MFEIYARACPVPDVEGLDHAGELGALGGGGRARHPPSQPAHLRVNVLKQRVDRTQQHLTCNGGRRREGQLDD